LKELKDAQSRLMEKDSQVESLKDELRQQSELMMKLQEEINNLLTD
jgi:peptidoglycan hydrolase CwlO-like protein